MEAKVWFSFCISTFSFASIAWCNPSENLRPSKTLPVNSSDKARKYLNYKTSVNLSDAIDKVINYIKIKGPKKFEYNYNLEINNKLTPKTWKNKEF